MALRTPLGVKIMSEESKVYKQEFPFDEVSRMDEDGDYGDYANNQQELRDRGYAESQIWSVVEADCDDDDLDCHSVFIYGPSHHFCNKIGYMATKEHHDGNTYYEDKLESCA
tara:strand:- start:187 stop:522 length:336 start_codon:yes stop_codon:yes gene_type:complete